MDGHKGGEMKHEPKHEAPIEPEIEEGIEEIPGLRVVEISNVADLGEYKSGIVNLKYNALDTEENRGPRSERKGDVKVVKHSLRRSGDHDAVYVAVNDNDKVVGYLSIKKTAMGGKKAEIRDLWTSVPGHSQRAIMGNLLGQAKSYLTEHGYPKLKTEVISPSADFSVTRANPQLQRFLKIAHPETQEPIEIEIEPEELEAANDNLPDSLDIAA